MINYNEVNYSEKEAHKPEECFSYKDTSTVTWINIDGLHETHIIETLGHHYNMHPLTMEDILHTGQRLKVEDYTDYLFVVLKMISFDVGMHEIDIEQISLILGPNSVISFQEKEGDIFESIRDRLRSAKGRIRSRGADYLFYCLIDTLVDHYFVVLENLSEEIKNLEDELMEQPTTNTLHTIHKLKREMILLRKSVWPLREVVSGLEQFESHLIKEQTNIYLRDVYDHTIQVIETIESFRDIIGGMLDTYLSSISNKMNEVMKMLTIIATIFIPLTFVAGIYGMNFEYMPELKWHWAYPVIWIIMLTLGLSMLIYFKRKKWL